MRVLHVIQELATGGAERVLLSLARAGVQDGGTAAVAAHAGDLSADFPGTVYPLRMIERRPQRLPGAVVDVARAMRSARADVVHAHNPAVALAVAAATLRGRRTPALVTVQGVPEEDYPPVARALRLAGLPVVACGPGVARALEDAGCPVAATIPNSVSPAPEPLAREAVAAELGFAPGAPLVVAVGRLVDQKHHDLAVQALADVPDAVLVIAGDGPLRSELEGLARERGVDGRLVLAGVRRDARALMGAADVAVLPSRWEGLPLAGIEALAGGTPLVATRVLGVAEAFEDGRDALLVDPDDPGALAAALGRVLADGDLRERLRQGGLQTAARYTEKAMVDRYFELYRGLVSR